MRPRASPPVSSKSDLEGVASHGVMLVNMYVERIRRGWVSTNASTQLISDRAAAVVLDAGHALGQLTGEQAMAPCRSTRQALRRGNRSGSPCLSLGPRNVVRESADAGCIGIDAMPMRPLMPAPGGAQRVVGDDPIAIAVAVAGPIPIVLDMATSEAAMGEIRMARETHRPIRRIGR